MEITPLRQHRFTLVCAVTSTTADGPVAHSHLPEAARLPVVFLNYHCRPPEREHRVVVVRVNLLALFFFNDTATIEIYPLSLHDALLFFFKEHASHLHSLTNLLCRLLL